MQDFIQVEPSKEGNVTWETRNQTLIFGTGASWDPEQTYRHKTTGFGVAQGKEWLKLIADGAPIYQLMAHPTSLKNCWHYVQKWKDGMDDIYEVASNQDELKRMYWRFRDGKLI